MQGWLEDYLDELDVYEIYPELEAVCRKLLKLFTWEKEYPSEIRFLLASAMGNQGKTQEARKYCEDWDADEKDNPLAAAALIYAKIREKKIDDALEQYDKKLGEYLMGMDEFYFMDDELPFN